MIVKWNKSITVYTWLLCQHQLFIAGLSPFSTNEVKIGNGIINYLFSFHR